MTRIIPRRKKHIIPLVVIGIILTVVLLYYTYYIAYMLVGDIDGYGCLGCTLSTANSNAKLAFTNFATYMTKCEEKTSLLRTELIAAVCRTLLGKKHIIGIIKESMPSLTARKKMF